MYSGLQWLSVVASCVFLVLLPFRLSKLDCEPVKVVCNHGAYYKVVLAFALVIIQCIALAIASTLPSLSMFWIDVGFLSAITSFLASIGVLPLLFWEHGRSVKPSDLVIVYLLASLACDIAELGTASYDDSPPSQTKAVLPILVTKLVTKLVIVLVESQGKKVILRRPIHSGNYDGGDGLEKDPQWPPEQLAGVLSRTFFWWINSILGQGARFILRNDSIPPLDQKLSSRLLRRRALKTWDRRKKPEGKMTLPVVLVRSMLRPFLAPIIPRLFLIAFRYAQPVLISNAIRHLSGGQSSSASRFDGDDVIDWRSGYAVILMSVVVFVGLAVSKAIYQHRINRLKTMTRGAVVGLINHKSLRQKVTHAGSYGDDGRAVTLMGTDTEGVCKSAQSFHETWAQTIEVVLGTLMLAQHVGWICLVPLIIIAFCSRMSRYLAKNLQSKQKDWNVATQRRLAMTTSMLTSIKSLKMLGVQASTESLIRDLRRKELDTAKKVRWMIVAYNASANALGIFSPIVTFVLFVVLAHYLNGKGMLDTETAFTTTALLGLVTHPANMIMSIIPEAIGSLAAFERIQSYLLQPPRQDQRTELRSQEPVDNDGTSQEPAIILDNLTLKVDPTAPSSPIILQNINLTIKTGDIVVCSGQVGCGKTSLLRAILGELTLASGAISVSLRQMACCDQSPWLPSGTLRQAIRGFTRHVDDQTWYNKVVELCCLDLDIAALPDGDDTIIGSRGLNLSGGQRQRVALARAVYARYSIVLLDDSFSALDGKTEDSIVKNLLGPDGYFKKTGTTVLLITNSSTYFSLADQIIILGDASVLYQGTWPDYSHTSHGMSQSIIHKVRGGGEAQDERKLQVDSAIQSRSLQVSEAISDINRATGDLSLYGYYLKSARLRNFLILLACTASYSLFVTFPQYWLQKWTEAPPSQTKFYIGGYLILSLMAWTSTNGSMWSTYILLAPTSGAELHKRLLGTIIGAPLSFFSVTDTGVILNRFSQDIQLVDRQLPPALLALSNQIFKLLVQATLLFSAQRLLTLTLPLCVLVVYLVQRIYLRTSRQLRLLDLESQSAVYSSFLETIEGISTIRAFAWEKPVEDANIRALDSSQKPAYLLLCLQQWLGIVLDLVVAAIATGLIGLAVLLQGTTTAAQIGMALNILLVANSTLLALVVSWTNLETSLGAITRLKNLEMDTPREEKPDEGGGWIPADGWPSAGKVELDDVSVAYGGVHSSDSSAGPGAVVALQNITLTVSPGEQLTVCGRTGSGKSTLLLALLRLLDVRPGGAIRVDGVDIRRVPHALVRGSCFITVSQDSFVLGQASLRFNLDPSSCLSDKAVVAALERTCLWRHFVSTSSSDAATIGGASALPERSQRHSQRRILNTPLVDLPHLSTGQTQMFSLARAVLQLEALRVGSAVVDIDDTSNATGAGIKPILLLDEATSSLDPETEGVMRRVIDEEFTKKGHTVIGITHRVGGLLGELGDVQRGVSQPTSTDVARETVLGQGYDGAVGDGKRSKVLVLSQGKVAAFGEARDVLGTLTQVART